MAQARAGAELAYSNMITGNTTSNQYANMCPTISTIGVPGTAIGGATEFGAALVNAQNAIGVPGTGATVATAGFVTCGADSTTYAASIKLNNTGTYCVDSTGAAGVKTGTITAGMKVCPTT